MSSEKIAPHVQHLIDNFLDIRGDSAILLENPIVVITADGTSVPLEANTVRSIDSMNIETCYSSQSAFAALSAEHFISQGYKVIYIHRQASIYFPFTKALQHIYSIERANQVSFIQSIVQIDQELQLCPIHPKMPLAAYDLIGLESQILRSIVFPHHSGFSSVPSEPTNTKQNFLFYSKKEHRKDSHRKLLSLDYHTIHEYFDLLEYLFQLSARFGPQICFYLTAKVSPYYVPLNELTTHKIQSDSAIELHLRKVRSPIPSYRSHSGKYAFVVETKLTDAAFEENVNSPQRLSCMNHIANNECHVAVLLSALTNFECTIVRDQELTNLCYREEDFQSGRGPQLGDSQYMDWNFRFEDVRVEFSHDSDSFDVLVGAIVAKIIECHKQYKKKNFCCRFKDGTKAIVTGSDSFLPKSKDTALSQEIDYYQKLFHTHLPTIRNLQREIREESQSTSEVKRRSVDQFTHCVSLFAGITTFAAITFAHIYLSGLS